MGRSMLKGLQAELNRIPEKKYFGHVHGIQGLGLTVSGIEHQASLGHRCRIHIPGQSCAEGEVVAIQGSETFVMALSPLQGVSKGTLVELTDPVGVLYPHQGWLGRVISGQGTPLDHKGPLKLGDLPYALKHPPLPAHERQRVQKPLDLGVRVINTFATCCQGQRMGIFSGSGVGKSVLLSQLAKFSTAEVNVIALIGERGREVQDFLESYLGPEGLAKSVVVVATSDETPLLRRQAAYVAVTLAEYFRDQGCHVLTLMDSVTRFAMALREIGLTAGEPPATKGYPPSVFGELPFLMERLGPGHVNRSGSITGLLTVLVEGDDFNEPVADTVRGILDGHIVLCRKIAERGRFPPVDVLKSLSRTMPDCHPPRYQALILQARKVLALYEDMADMIRLGAYIKGTDPDLDKAIQLFPRLESYMAQGKEEGANFHHDFQKLEAILTAGHQKKEGPHGS